MKNIVKILIFLICFSFLNTIYWESWITDTSNEIEEESIDINSINIQDELKNDWIDLNTNWKGKNIVDKASEIKNLELNKAFWKSEEEKNIEILKDAVNELKIKKDVNANQLIEIQESIKLLQKNISDNNDNLKLLNEKNKNESLELVNELNSAKETNEKLKKDLDVKKKLEKDLSNSIDWYNLLQIKYDSLLEGYVDLEKEKEKALTEEKIQKLIYLWIFLLLFIIAYLIKIFLTKNNNFMKKYKNFWEYFNFLFWLSLIIFLIVYAFYIFPELYAVFILISWTLLIINSQVISSFIASFVLFRNFKIWDIIKIWDQKWKIIKMNPISTIVRKINSYWIMSNEEINIPNIDMIKDKVTIVKIRSKVENSFSVIISLSNWSDLFKIIRYIKTYILSKNLKDGLYTINSSDTEKYKIRYEYIDSDKIKVNFYWIADSATNRKIEYEIIKYIKKVAIYDNTKKTVNSVLNNNDNLEENEKDFIKKSVTVLDELSV